MQCCSVIIRFNLRAVLLFAVLTGGCAPAILPTDGVTPLPRVLPADGDAATDGVTPRAFHLTAAAVVRPDNEAARRVRIIWRRTSGEDGAHDAVRIKDQFGVTHARLLRTPQQAMLDMGGKKITGKNAAVLAEKILGYPLPVEAFGYWIVGVPAPGAASSVTPSVETTRNIAGEIAEISQFGWRISYLRRDGDGKPLDILLIAPAAKNVPAATIDIKIKEWLLPY